jgi:hypothetical protein
MSGRPKDLVWLECHVHRRVPLRDPNGDLYFLPLNLCCMTCMIPRLSVFELFVFELSTHLCTPNIILFGVVFLCITINYWLGVVFNTNLCQHHIKIFMSFEFITERYKSLPQRYKLFIPRYTAGYRLYRRFWFGFWIWAIRSGMLFIPLRYTLTVG